MAIDAGDSGCTSGLSGSIYSSWSGDAASGFSSPLGADQTATVKAQCYRWAQAIASAVNASGGSLVGAQQSSTCTAAGPVSPGFPTPASGYPTMSFTAPSTGNYIVDVCVEFVPSNAADTARFGVSVDGSGGTQPSYWGDYPFVAAQLGLKQVLRFSALVYLAAGTHTLGIAWGTPAAGYLATTTDCHVLYTVHA